MALTKWEQAIYKLVREYSGATKANTEGEDLPALVDECMGELARQAEPMATIGLAAFRAGWFGNVPIAEFVCARLAATADAPVAEPVALTYCQYCQGSGESTQMVGGGPDAHEEPCSCDKCAGTGVFQAGRIVDVGQLEYRGNSVSHIQSKATAYGYVIDLAWDALKKAGVKPDGHTSLADGIARLAALAAPPAPQPTEADPDPADIIAGALSTSRAHAYELMRAALQAEAPVAEPVATIRKWTINGEVYADQVDWGDGLDILPDGVHQVFSRHPAPSAAEDAKDAERYRTIRNPRTDQDRLRRCALVSTFGAALDEAVDAMAKGDR